MIGSDLNDGAPTMRRATFSIWGLSFSSDLALHQELDVRRRRPVVDGLLDDGLDRRGFIVRELLHLQDFHLDSRRSACSISPIALDHVLQIDLRDTPACPLP